ncbi:MAG: Lrp/AsnC family transcriptional regulator [Desulfobacterales bacterium]|nr:Lrp/AsnC family transcriptional regulator [Deltaproteobacteria bacterium]MBT8361543.1 Lrp/AsnC family transcriptional regulator [Deltaproteobacteria bacterium]NNK93150.1 Lrp/AsnC family transcriptional regulator [Desulfobacterales bacterium]
MDKRNFQILAILQRKARIPNVEVARLVDMAPSAVLERIRKMESQGIIDGYEVRLNPDRFNCRQISFMYVYFSKNSDPGIIGDALEAIEEIQEIHFIAGEDCYLIKLRTADTNELNTLLQTRIIRIEGIRSTRTYPVLSTRKETAQIPIRP